MFQAISLTSLWSILHWKDIVDILLVSILLYQLYKIIKGTVAVNVFIGILAIYLVNLIVNFLQMKLLGTIFSTVLGVGAIALIILFQQEIRKFLILIGIKSYNSKQAKWLFDLVPFLKKKRGSTNTKFKPIINACYKMSKTKTGALIVISNDTDLSFYSSTGDQLDANVNARLIENIFFKNSPLHDGAVIISKDRIVAARCVLPVTENENFPAHFGMRHRAAAGISELSDCIVVLVSEETGDVSYAKNGKIKSGISSEELTQLLNRDYKVD